MKGLTKMAGYAVIETGGKQYRVHEGDTLFIEKLNGAGITDDTPEGFEITFDKVLFISDGEGGIKTGAPLLSGAAVKAAFIKDGKGKKIRIFTYKSKKGEKRAKGHRQPYTKVKITSING